MPKQESNGFKDQGSGADVVLQGLEEPKKLSLDI